MKRTILSVLLVFWWSLSAPQVFAQESMRGLDRANLDVSASPCQDFYQFANGGWLSRNPVPAEYSSWGSFSELTERNFEVLKSILEEASAEASAVQGSNRQKIGDFYAAGMDSGRVESLRWEPIRDELARVGAVTDFRGLQDELALLTPLGVRPLFGLFVGQDAKNSEQMMLQLSQGGLGLPDREYYIEQDEKSRKLREAYVEHMTAMFQLTGASAEDAAASARSVMAFETGLAKASRTRVERRDPDKNYNKMTPEQLAALTPTFDWKRYFAGVGLQQPGDVNVGQPEFFQAVDRMIADTPLEAWKTYVRWNIIRSAAPNLSSDFVNENFRFYGTTLQGSTQLQPRWKRILQTINGLMGEALGELYVARAFSPVAKQRARAMVDHLLLAYRHHLERNEWMDDSTKSAALQKLSTFGVKVGYPDVWRDYTALEISRSSHLANLRRAGAFEFRRNLEKLGQPVDRNEWFMPPQTVNAYYNAARNEIVFPAGILQPPFFDPEADDAVNFGGMGAVIGHEITHGFDDRGSKYDPDGNLRNWWTQSSRTEFERRAELMVQQYDGYVVIDSMTVNGKLTIGENIADLGGLTIAYTALRYALEGTARPAIDGFTPEQRFFLAWAQIWRRNVRPEALRLQVKTDSHSPARFRVQGPLANMPQFQQAFGCGEGAGFLRAGNERITIW